MSKVLWLSLYHFRKIAEVYFVRFITAAANDWCLVVYADSLDAICYAARFRVV